MARPRRSLERLVAAALLALAPTIAFPAEAEKLTLKQSLERASQNNSRLLLARKELDVAQTQLRQAKSQFFPKVNLGLNYVRYSHETLGLIPPEMGPIVLESAARNSAAEDLYLGRLGFLQTLYAGGKLDYTYKLSKANVKRAESAVETLRQEIEYETASAFFLLVKLRREEALIRTALENLEKLERHAARTHDRLSASVARAEIRQRLGELLLHQEAARIDYRRAMGVELFAAVDVEGTLDAEPAETDLQTALVWAKQNRAAIRETQLQEEVDQLSVDLSLSERYPVFLLGGGVEQRNASFPLEESNWNAGLSMNIPIFDGFSSLARIRESRHRADQSRLRRVEVEDQIEADVRSAFHDLQHWNNEMAARQKELAVLEKARPSYLGGGTAKTSIEDRLAYITWILDAAVGALDARFQWRLALARLDRATGRSVGNGP